MAAKGDHELEQILGDSSHDELWLISYADLTTLLIGFFVLLLAASPMKLARFERMAAALSNKSPPPLAELKQKVDAFIEKERLKDQVMTVEDADGLNIEFKDALLFDSASAQIRPVGGDVLSRLALLIKDIEVRPVVIEGHTDDRPIKSAQFNSNWELSSQRAINVLSLLETRGVTRDRLSARGYADTRPVKLEAPVDVIRAANRRVVIRVE